jgi:hypothetical protein
VLPELADETAILRDLGHRVAGKTRAWFVVYPQARSPFAASVEVALRDQSCGSELFDWMPIQATAFELCNPAASG